MFNLLPLASQKSVSNEYRFRVASACIIALAVLVFLAGVSLIPAYVSSINQAKLFQAQYDSVHEVAGQKVDDSMAKLLGATKAKLDLSQPYLETSAASEMVSRVVEHQTAGIALTAFRFGADRRGRGSGEEDHDCRSRSRPALPPPFLSKPPGREEIQIGRVAGSGFPETDQHRL